MKNLLGRLIGRSYDELKQIAAALQLPPARLGQNELAMLLYRELIDETSVKWIWGELTAQERNFVNWLMDQRASTAFVDTLAVAFSLNPAEVQAMLQHISQLGIVDIEDVLAKNNRVVTSQYRYATKGNPADGAERRPAVSISSEVSRVLKKIAAEMTEPPRFDLPVSKLLEQYELAQLEQIATNWKLKFSQPAYYKDEVADVLLGAFAEPERVRAMLAILPDNAQAIYRLLEQHSGRMTLDALRRAAVLSEAEMRQSLRLLGQRFLVLETYTGAVRNFFIPKDIMQPDVQPHTPPPPITAFVGEPQRSAVQQPHTLAWDILTVLAFVKQNKFSLTAHDDTHLPKRVSKRLNELLLQPDSLDLPTNRLELILHLCLALDLLRVNPERDRLLLTAKADEWAALGFAAQSRRLAHLWLDDKEWFEPAVYAAGFWWAGNITFGRHKVVDKLLELAPGQWYATSSLVNYFEVADPYIFFRNKQDAVRFMGGYRNLTSFATNWPQREGRVIAAIVTSGLHWLGLADVGYDATGQAVAFRLGPEASSRLHEDGPLPPAEATKSLLLQPNFEVLVFKPESVPLWYLLQIADLSRHDMVSVYTISRESIQRALESGFSVAAIQQFLQAQSQREVPQNVARSIEDWARAVKRVRLTEVTLLEVDDPTVLDELAAGRKTSSYVLRRLNPTTALVKLPDVSAHARDSAVSKVTKALRTAGYAANLAEKAMNSSYEE